MKKLFVFRITKKIAVCDNIKKLNFKRKSSNVELEFNSFPVKYAKRKLDQLAESGQGKRKSKGFF